MKSVLPVYNSRGPWGDSNWRGNMSGHTLVELIHQYKPNYLVDICCGSDTSGDVCREMGIAYTGLDLMNGQDYTRDYVLSQIKRPADLVFSHMAYHNMIDYVAERKNMVKT